MSGRDNSTRKAGESKELFCMDNCVVGKGKRQTFEDCYIRVTNYTNIRASEMLSISLVRKRGKVIIKVLAQVSLTMGLMDL